MTIPSREELQRFVGQPVMAEYLFMTEDEVWFWDFRNNLHVWRQGALVDDVLSLRDRTVNLQRTQDLLERLGDRLIPTERKTLWRTRDGLFVDMEIYPGQLVVRRGNDNGPMVEEHIPGEDAAERLEELSRRYESLDFEPISPYEVGISGALCRSLARFGRAGVERSSLALAGSRLRIDGQEQACGSHVEAVEKLEEALAGRRREGYVLRNLELLTDFRSPEMIAARRAQLPVRRPGETAREAIARLEHWISSGRCETVSEVRWGEPIPVAELESYREGLPPGYIRFMSTCGPVEFVDGSLSVLSLEEMTVATDDMESWMDGEQERLLMFATAVAPDGFVFDFARRDPVTGELPVGAWYHGEEFYPEESPCYFDEWMSRRVDELLELDDEPAA